MKEDKNLLLRLPKMDAERFTTAPEDRNTYTCMYKYIERYIDIDIDIDIDRYIYI